MTPFSSIATRVASKRVPSSGSFLEDEGVTRERQGLWLGEEGGCWGCWRGFGGGAGSWRREKKSLMSWVERSRVPFEVRREMRASLFVVLVSMLRREVLLGCGLFSPSSF
jgi:hypothetical protein